MNRLPAAIAATCCRSSSSLSCPSSGSAPVLFPALTGRTLLPYDNLYTFEPWRSLQPDLVPHNELLSDLVLENAVWKLHIRRTLADGQLPLWNPKIFTGLPFLAAGQASTFYPLSLLFYVLPLELAYGWFTALQIALAGINMYLLARVLRSAPLSPRCSAAWSSCSAASSSSAWSSPCSSPRRYGCR